MVLGQTWNWFLPVTALFGTLGLQHMNKGLANDARRTDDQSAETFGERSQVQRGVSRNVVHGFQGGFKAPSQIV